MREGPLQIHRSGDEMRDGRASGRRGATRPRPVAARRDAAVHPGRWTGQGPAYCPPWRGNL